jgi:hypothetical protein
MRTLPSEPTARSTPSLALVVREPESPWAARGLTVLVPPASLAEARVRRDELAMLLGRERAAAADFLLALADFDRRRGWERLGHASLFSFLTRELGLSKGAAFLRLSAARLLPRHPAVEAALRRGDLCLSAVGELARVLTPENEADVLPRYLGCSSREAREVSAALLPVPAPPVREVVTRLAVVAGRSALGPLALALAPAAPQAAVPGATAPAGAECSPVRPPAGGDAASPSPAFDPAAASPQTAIDEVRAHEPHPLPPGPRTPEVQPLTADLRRLHLTVSRAFLEKVAAARTGLSHARPGATTEQVLEAALDLLLEQQARRKALVKRPRTARAPTAQSLAPSPPTPPTPSAAPPPPDREAPPTSARPDVPAHVEREVRLRDGDRCQFPLDAGGVCGSTWKVELDHVIPDALGGPTTVANLRCACRVHNQYAARQALGEPVMAERRRRRPR